jgi:uncharacterized damage-inducible protein DinB
MLLKLRSMRSGDYIQTMCRYNRWMNAKLYLVCATIPDAIRKEDKKAFFRSIHGTLNHPLLADRVWLGRFKDQPFEFHSLDQELYSDFEELRREREKTDEEIDQWALSLTEGDLLAPLTFKSAALGREVTFPLWHCVLHFFNHQTHHRGQLTTLLEQAGFDSGVTDLLWMLMHVP